MNMTKYCFHTEPMARIEKLCEQMTGKALQSPYRSTVPLLSLVEHSQPDWQSLLAQWRAPSDSTVHFEYRVTSPKPRGNPSQTDALLMLDSMVWAVEAKWTEPRYETVAKRMSKPESDGADPRTTVTGWLKYLQPFAGKDLCVDDFSEVVYQVLHRAASACAVATAEKLQPHLVYLHFHPSPLPSSATTSQYISGLRNLYTLIDSPGGIRFTVVELPLKPTAAFEVIKDLDKKSRETAVQVKAALCNGPLFTFGNPILTQI
jgi:hypothetical protein